MATVHNFLLERHLINLKYMLPEAKEIMHIYEWLNSRPYNYIVFILRLTYIECSI